MRPFKKRARSGTVDDTDSINHSSSSNIQASYSLSSGSSNDSSAQSSYSTMFMANTYVSSQVSRTSSTSCVETELAVTDNNNSVHRKQMTSVKEVVASIPEGKSAELIPIPTMSPFSCDMTCTQYIHYQLLQNDTEHGIRDVKQFELEKLDTVLNASSTLRISCTFLVNGLDNILDYPDWITDSLVKIMGDCGFSPAERGNAATDVGYDEQPTTTFRVAKAFVTTPLSYILDKQTPHAVLDKLEIVFDFSNHGSSNEFVTNWRRKFNVDTISKYMDHALAQILLKKTFYMYPLIFTSSYAKKLSQTSAYLPHIAQSLQKIYLTSRSTMSVSNHEFSESMLEKLKVIRKNVEILCPPPCQRSPFHDVYATEEDETSGESNQKEKESADPATNAHMFSSYLTLAMYQSIKKDNKPKTSPARTASYDPPNALCTIAQLWSVTCSTVSSTD